MIPAAWLPYRGTDLLGLLAAQEAGLAGMGVEARDQELEPAPAEPSSGSCRSGEEKTRRGFPVDFFQGLFQRDVMAQKGDLEGLRPEGHDRPG